MSSRKLVIFSVFLSMAACKDPEGGVTLGSGAELDARFVSDVYTWQCEAKGYDNWEGIYALNVSLEYVPDGLVPRELGAIGGCTSGLTMFGMDEDSTGADIPDIDDEPRWQAGEESGELGWIETGFYYDEAYEDQHRCDEAEQQLISGTELTGAGALTGAITPDPGIMNDVTLTVEGKDAVDSETGFDFGDAIFIEWEAAEWDETWIQIRRERDGVAWETVTCNASGLTEFWMDEEKWDLLDENVPAEVNNVYVAFQNTAEQTMADGQRVIVATRAMHVAVVSD